MSDENAPQPPAKPTAKTSTVPLKKETVRITLRAKPGTGITQPKKSTGVVPEPKKATAPISEARKATAPVPTLDDTIPVPLPTKSTAHVPQSPSNAPGAPSPPRPAAPTGAKTVALRPPGSPAVPSPGGAPTMPLGSRPPIAAPAPGGAPTMPLRKAPPLAAPAGAKTIPLAQSPGAVPPGQITGQMRPAGTQALPKATVKLGTPTAPMSAPPKSAPVDSQLLEDEKDPDSGMLVLSVIALVLALLVMVMEMTTSDKVINHPVGEDTQLTVPYHDNQSWDRADSQTGKYMTDTKAEERFKQEIPDVPVRPVDQS